MMTIKEKSCVDCDKNKTPLSLDDIHNYLKKLTGWSYDSEEKEISKTFEFSNYHKTMAFVNAIAWLAHQHRHHPDLEVHYNRCRVRFSTHEAGGVTESDIICAAKTDALFSI